MPRVSLVSRAHETIARVLKRGDIAVDATLGNGHDTLFLARSVGAGGHVFGFDVQQAALDGTRARLEQEGVAGRVELYLCGHERMAERIGEGYAGRVRAVMFNLGYLPRSDKACTTRAETTIQALDQALELLAPGGVVSLLAYTGHSGGREEAEVVKAWAASLSPTTHRVEVEIPESVDSNAPELITVFRV